MKRRAILSGLLAGALMLTLAACSGPEPEPTVTPSAEPTSTAVATPEPTPTPTPAAEAPVWGDQVFAKTFTAGDGATVLTASFTLPLVQNTDACPAGTAINDWYKQEGSSRMLEAEEQYEMAVADYDVSQAAGFLLPTTQEMTYTVAYEDEDLISIRRELYVAAEGAAHPSAFLLAETFDAATGEKLGFSRVFTDADTVRERAVDAFVSQYGLEDSRDAVTVAWQPERFYLSAEGYVFWLAGGELPGVNSPIEVTLSYESMEDVSVYG